MGVTSRRIRPVCEALCVCCPSLRVRSRHPVKRYKQLLADIFPRTQGGGPNEKKIGKLCEYASKNPLRIPKITDYLEQKFYRNLRNENVNTVKSVLLVYGKLISSCNKQMSLFATSFLGIVGSLLVQTQNHEMQILGCHALVNFINNQVDSAYVFNLEGLIPKLCQLAEEVGDDERVLRLRSAGLQVLSFLVRFMGEQPHASVDFENIISVTLENYTNIQPNQENTNYNRQLSQTPSFSDLNKASDLVKPQDDPPADAHKNPSYWAHVCLHNMARSANGPTNVRRVLEPIFNKFDTDKLWVGPALSVLKYLLMVLEESDDRSHLLLPILIKHLDNKDVSKEPILQLQIVNVVTQVSECVKQHDSITVVGAITDLIEHLCKCIQKSSESSIPTDDSYNDLQSALKNCISNLSCKVGDVGPVFDTMALVLEKIPITAAMARANISAVYLTAQIITSIPNKTNDSKAFPDALFHQLLVAMTHPDHETRLVAHRAFSIVLIPSLSQTWSIDDVIPLESGFPLTVSENSNKSVLKTIDEETMEKDDEKTMEPATESVSCAKASTSDTKTARGSMRLNGHQVSLVLSSIWIQATSMQNAPANFEAMAQTFTLALSFILSKASYHVALIVFFRLAFSLRSIALYRQGGQQPSQRRPVFMLASYMIIVSAKACQLREIISIVKSTLTEETMDPYLLLDEDVKLQAVCTNPRDKNIYGSQTHETSGMKSLSTLESKEKLLKDTLSSHLLYNLGKSSQEELSDIKSQLSQWFMPDEEYPLGAPLFMGTSSPEFQTFDEEVMAHAESADEDGEDGVDEHGSQSDGKVDILSVNQLMESVVETSHQVENMAESTMPLSYDEIKKQCETLVMGKQQIMSVLKEQKDAEMGINSFGENENHVSNNQLEVGRKSYEQECFRLPALSPYDKFLQPAR